MDKEHYLVDKSRGHISFMNNQGEMDSKYCALYIYLKAECLKVYAQRMHNVHYESFPFSEITFGKDKLARLLEEVKAILEKLVWMCQITKSKVFYIISSQ